MEEIETGSFVSASEMPSDGGDCAANRTPSSDVAAVIYPSLSKYASRSRSCRFRGAAIILCAVHFKSLRQPS